MFSRRRDAGDSRPSTPQRSRYARMPLRRGLFQDGGWKCNCDPRLPAEKFQVKKQNANHGRWFYTCQKEQAKRCDFFLWQDDAQAREEGAVLNNSRTEPDPPQSFGERRQPEPAPPSNQHAPPKSPPPPYSLTVPPSRKSKRKLPWKEYPADDTSRTESEEDWGMDGAEEQEMAKIASRMPETPRKAVKTAALDTPSRTSRENPQNIPTPSKTPSTFRQTDVFATPLAPPSFPSPQKSFNLFSETLELLKQHKIRPDGETADALHALFDKHDLRVQGIVKGFVPVLASRVDALLIRV